MYHISLNRMYKIFFPHQNALSSGHGKRKTGRTFSRGYHNFHPIVSRMLHKELVTHSANPLSYPTRQHLLACGLSCGLSTPITMDSYNVFHFNIDLGFKQATESCWASLAEKHYKEDGKIVIIDSGPRGSLPKYMCFIKPS